MANLFGLASLGAAIISDLFIKSRSIDVIIPQITLDETLRDELAITQHPVEFGAQITDHAYRQPFEVTARYGWDNSIVPSMSSLISDPLGALNDISFTKAKDIYAKLVKLQQERRPFLLSTGKRNYKDMLIASLICTTDPKTENVLMVTCVFREVIIVKVRSAKVGPVSGQAVPWKTQETVNQGTAATAPASSAATNGLLGRV